MRMLSIVIPLYNKALSIENTLRCIQNQTVQDYEIVIVDGYSTDGSLPIVQRLAAEDTRVRLFMQQNRHGVTPARNESVQYARGEHVVFMDADDYWEPTYLQSMQQLIADYPQAGIWGIAYGTMQDEQKQPNRKWQEGLYAGFRGLLPDNPWRAWGCPYWTSATAISKTAFESVSGFDNSIIYGEDIDLWWRIMLRFPAAFDATQTLAYYRIDAENRACDHVFPLSIHIPSHIDKYAQARADNADFRYFFDRQILYRLFPYCFHKEYKEQVKHILSQIDFSLQKKSMYWRFRLPYLYRWLKRGKGVKEQELQAYTGAS